jgi:hypothetical protein
MEALLYHPLFLLGIVMFGSLFYLACLERLAPK